MKGLLQVAAFAFLLSVQIQTTIAANGLVVHEWGTFTALQDERGRCLDGINTDDEPVPNFVHQLAKFSLIDSSTEIPAFLSQGAPFAQPNVTMRLETPVIYFHPADGNRLSVDVKVQFRGGLLTEYYPQPNRAEPAVDFQKRKDAFTTSSLGVLEWNNLQIGPAAPGPATEDPVWLAPRHVNSSDVKTTTGESERFLFYRGLGAGEPPLKVVQEKDHLVIHPTIPPEIKIDFHVPQLWLVDIQKEGVAFRAANAFDIPAGDTNASKTIPSTFSESDYSPANALKLRRALLAALLKEGLFEDEATALLETWKISYFQSAGLRLFFIVPQAWTDHVLPLEIPQTEKIVRVMVGRIELVSPRQRQLLANINRATPAEIQKAAEQMRSRVFNKFYPQNGRSDPTMVTNIDLAYRGRRSLAAFGIKSVPLYQAYLDLGRFRHTLVKHSTANSAGLTAFAEAFRL